MKLFDNFKSENNLSLEAINVQPSNFFKELSTVVELVTEELQEWIHSRDGEDYAKRPNARSYDDLLSSNNVHILKEIDKVVKKYTNMSIITYLNPKAGSWACLPLYYSPNNVLNDIYSKHAYRVKKLGVEKSVKGFVDLKKGRVDGDFAEEKIALFVSMADIGNKLLSAEEMAAIILHEVGHMFTFFDFLHRTAQTNYILDEYSKRIAKSKSAEEKAIVIKEWELKVKDKNQKAPIVKDPKKPTIAEYTVLIRCSISTIDSLNDEKNKEYNNVAAEQQADLYATRHGAGLYIASGLKKILESSGVKIKRANTFFWIIGEIYRVTCYILIYTFDAILNSLPSGYFKMLLSFLTLYRQKFFRSLLNESISGSNITNHRYDRLNERFNRIKEELVNQLKDPFIPDVVRANLVNDIKVLDDTISTIESRKSFILLLYENINRLRAEEVNRELERLANNELFVLNSQFKLIK